MLNFFKKKRVTTEENVKTVSEDYNDVSLIAEYFKNETGVTFDKHTEILKNKVTAFCRQREIYSFAKLLEIIKFDSGVKQALIDNLTTNETFFYREFKQIEELVYAVKTGGVSVNILCAPCATGEEPYSIAIALLEAGVNENKFHITGIDINLDAINKAMEAVYRERNLRNLSEEIINRHFTKKDNLYILNNNIKSKVTLKVLNLFDSSFKNIGKFDYIFSRNMLIYFDKETKEKAKRILEELRKNSNQEIFFGHADLF